MVSCGERGELWRADKHDDVIKWKHFPRYWPFVRRIHVSPLNSPHKRQWRGSLLFSLICAWINRWVNNREAGDLRRHRVNYYVIIMNLPPTKKASSMPNISNLAFTLGSCTSVRIHYSANPVTNKLRPFCKQLLLYCRMNERTLISQ